MSAAEVRGRWVPDAAFALLRAFVAALLIAHGAQDLFGVLLPEGTRWIGAPAPLTDRWIAATIELAGGALLLLGFLTRLAAAALCVVVVIAAFAARSRGHWVPASTEAIVLYAGILSFFAIAGGGMFSLDAPRAGRPRRRRTAMTVSMSPWLEREYRRRELTR